MSLTERKWRLLRVHLCDVFCRRARWCASPFPTCSRSSSPQLRGFSFPSCAALQRIPFMKAQLNLQDAVKCTHAHPAFLCVSHFKYVHRLYRKDILLLQKCLKPAFLRCRFGGSGSYLSALDLSDAGPAAHAFSLPQPILQPPEEYQVMCQHGSEKRVYQRLTAGPRWQSTLLNYGCLCSDIQLIFILFSYLKSLIETRSKHDEMQLITAYSFFSSGVSFSEAKLMGLTSSQGTGAIPREMSFPVPKGGSWHDLYEYIRYRNHTWEQKKQHAYLV